jgi:GTP-binding protein
MTNKNIPKFFNSPQFVASYFSVNKLPQHSCREVVFAGRSNCGKSSLINAITGQKKNWPSLAKPLEEPARLIILSLTMTTI